MLQRSSGAPAAAALLTIWTEHGQWALPCSAVVGVETAAAAPTAEPPFDLGALLGAPSSEPARDDRVLVVQSGERRRRVRIAGQLHLVEGAAVQLLPLPPELRRMSPLVSHVATVGGKPTLFVVSPERLLESLPDAPHGSEDAV
jgi:hypothetical protein